MENEVYERDYGTLLSEPDPAQKTMLKRMGAFLHDIDMQQPRVISPRGRFIYDHLLRECDAYCRLCCGKIRAVIDYQNWEAKIVLILPALYCRAVEQKALLFDILLHTKAVSFLPVENTAAVAVEIRIEYFEKLPCGAEEESGDIMIEHMRAAAEKMCRGDPVLMEKVRKIFEKYEPDNIE